MDNRESLDGELTSAYLYRVSKAFKESEGGHTWLNWRQYLHDYASQLFK